jgi:hypothetical protein
MKIPLFEIIHEIQLLIDLKKFNNRLNSIELKKTNLPIFKCLFLGKKPFLCENPILIINP